MTEAEVTRKLPYLTTIYRVYSAASQLQLDK